MTVGRLIEELRQLAPTLPVIVQHSSGLQDEIERVRFDGNYASLVLETDE